MSSEDNEYGQANMRASLDILVGMYMYVYFGFTLVSDKNHLKNFSFKRPVFNGDFPYTFV